MPKYNRKCFYCGKEYYCCSSCVGIHSWKNTHCSIECYLKSQEENKDAKAIIIEEGGKKMVVLRAGLANGKTIDIVGYDLELGKFDCSDGMTRVFDDFSYFIVPRDEMKEFAIKEKPIVKPPKVSKEKVTVPVVEEE